MPGQGKYTVYAPESNEKNNLMSKLYPESPTASFVGKENEYREIVNIAGNAYLSPSATKGDAFFGPGVNLDYKDSPNILTGEEGKWSKPGDPANSFTPDVSSPGPGKTDGTDKSVDPEIKASDIKPNYVAGGPATGTRSPAEYAKKIGSLMLGKNTKLGTSDSSS